MTDVLIVADTIRSAELRHEIPHGATRRTPHHISQNQNAHE